jgi:hypothetical protein
MRDLRADWRRWSRAERLSALVFLLGATLTPVLLPLAGAAP